jgi:carotenoid cleavage dioxygenase-like enzyme
MAALPIQSAHTAPSLFTALGADTQDRPQGEVVVTGELPPALDGVLFRNGPGQFRRGGKTKRTVLDGDGVIQRLEIGLGRLKSISLRIGATAAMTHLAPQHRVPG